MEIDMKTVGFDGKDEIFFSNSFNVYENELTIPDLLGFTFKFIFEDTEPKEGQKDIVFEPTNGKEVVITLSKKFRNSLGSITANKLGILNTSDNRQILLSIFGQQVGSDNLHVTINFYLR